MSDLKKAAPKVPDDGPLDEVAAYWRQRALSAEGKTKWSPIRSAPKDNKRPLYLARFNEDGKLVELTFDGGWEYWQESWELPDINGWAWVSNDGMEEPTHWAYQDQPIPQSKESE